MLHLLPDKWMEIGQNDSKFLEQSRQCRCLLPTRHEDKRNTDLLLSSAFIFHRRLHFRCVKQMFCLRLSAVFCRIMKPTSQSQHCAQVISHLSLFPPHTHTHTHTLKETTACFTSLVLYFPRPKFDETFK